MAGPVRVATRVVGGPNQGTYFVHGDHLGLNILVGARGGGYDRKVHTCLFNTTGVIGAIFVLMVMMVTFNVLLNRLEDHIVRWRPKTQMGGEPTEVR